MDGQAALWAAILASGVYHGLNPGMGWPLAVAAGLTERRGAAVARTLAPLAAGHLLSIAVVLLPFGALTVLLDWSSRDPHRRRPGDHRVFGSVASLSAPSALARTRAPHSGDALVVFCSAPARGRADAGSDVTGPLRASFGAREPAVYRHRRQRRSGARGRGRAHGCPHCRERACRRGCLPRSRARDAEAVMVRPPSHLGRESRACGRARRLERCVRVVVERRPRATRRRGSSPLAG